MSDALLSDLCSICNTSKSKYRCPGCAARTCSLPCYKRHQQWAQCSGKRDPTKYVKKSQLATPAGIDHDFNFLTSIERGLERAEKNVGERGLGTPSETRTNARHRQPTDEQFAAAGVTVIRAPKGLSRQRENRTRVSGRRNLIWTVEWIREDKSRTLTDSNSTESIISLQPFKLTKKRKRAVDHPPPSKATSTGDGSILSLDEAGKSRVKTEDDKPEPSAPKRRIDGSDHTNGSTEGQRGSDAEVAEISHPSSTFHQPDPESFPIEYSFYLLKPRTSSSRHVLIPISPTATLTECLRGRTVLEYPTIYAFPGTMLPPGEEFMLEEEYIKQEGEDQKEFEDLIKNVSPDILRTLKEEAGDKNANDDIDSKKILDVLKQDIGAGV